MGGQRKNIWIKEKEAPTEKKLSKIEASELPDIEFRVTVIKMLKELRENYTSMKKAIEAMNKKELHWDIWRVTCKK